jgi:hypothetical protein
MMGAACHACQLLGVIGTDADTMYQLLADTVVAPECIAS